MRRVHGLRGVGRVDVECGMAARHGGADGAGGYCALKVVVDAGVTGRAGPMAGRGGTLRDGLAVHSVAVRRIAV